MNYPTPHPSITMLFIAVFLLLNASCSKDSDLFDEAISENIAEVQEQNQNNNSTTEDESSTDGQQDNTSPIASELKAFPSAEGFGKYTTGGRGGIVVEVTNLNDDGPGSLREALKMKQRRTIVFKVSGVIECNDFLVIPSDAGNVTIAGQTAPGDGITIKGAEFRIQASNVIVRYLKIRPGEGLIGDSNEDALRIVSYQGRRVENVIIDHCSLSWGSDENLAIGGIGSESSVRNVTIQNTLIAENIGSQYGLLLWNDSKNISIYRNLLAHNKERNIRSSTCTSNFEMINNVVYGYSNATSPTYENHFDIVGNAFITNPLVAKRFEEIRLEASTNNCPDGNIENTRAFVEDNRFNGSSISLSSNLEPYLETQRIFDSGIDPIASSRIVESVLDDVGANIFRGSVDERIISDVVNLSGGLINGLATVGGYPFYEENFNSYEDSDRDGMADNWELNNGLNPNDDSDGNKDTNGDGYTNLEHFLFSLTAQ